MGVSLLMMLIGVPPYKKPSLSDPYFRNISNGYLKRMIKAWELNETMSKSAYDLLDNIFKPENERISINDIVKHKYIKNIKIYQ